MEKCTIVTKFASFGEPIVPAVFWMTVPAVNYATVFKFASFLNMLFMAIFSMLTKAEFIVKTDRTSSHCEDKFLKFLVFFYMICLGDLLLRCLVPHLASIYVHLASTM